MFIKEENRCFYNMGGECFAQVNGYNRPHIKSLTHNMRLNISPRTVLRKKMANDKIC